MHAAKFRPKGEGVWDAPQYRDFARPLSDRPQPAWVSSKLLLCGGVAGAVSKTATAPLARLTILYQAR